MKTGTAFEARMKRTFDQYERRGVATVRKVDPPTRTVKVRGKTMVIQLPSIYLDFCGAWTEKGGIMLMVECKSTDRPRLEIRLNDEGGGIKLKQIQSAARWEASGAAVCFLWEHGGEVRMVTTWKVLAHIKEGRKSVPWSDAIKIPCGDNFVDFLPFLSTLTKESKTARREPCRDTQEVGNSSPQPSGSAEQPGHAPCSHDICEEVDPASRAT